MKKNESPKYDLKCVYAGKRLWGNKVYQVFIPTNGKKEMRFSGAIRGVYLGYTYFCGKENISTRPERSYEDERIDNPEWEAQEELVNRFRAKQAANRKIKTASQPYIKKALEALTPLAQGRPFYEVHSLIEFLTMKVYDAAKKASKKD